MKPLVPLLSLTLLAGATALIAQTPIERDELAFIADDHPDMVAAMRKARATLKDFLALARAPRPNVTSLAVKVAVREGEDVEYFWIGDFDGKDSQFSGRIDNIPRLVKRVREGETIKFVESEIVDWLYLENGKMKGNFTACALIKQESKKDAAAFKKRFRLDCDS